MSENGVEAKAGESEAAANNENGVKITAWRK
jgi:hypothetical protein